MIPYPNNSTHCPIDALPDLLYDAAYAVHAMDDEIPAPILLLEAVAASAAAVHLSYDVRGLDERAMPTTINTLLLAPSGHGKGSSYQAFFMPFMQFEGHFELGALQQDVTYRALMETLNGRLRGTNIQHEDGIDFLQSDLFKKHLGKLTQLYSGIIQLSHKVHRTELIAMYARCSLGFRSQQDIFYPTLRKPLDVSYAQGLWPRTIAAQWLPGDGIWTPAYLPTSEDGLIHLHSRIVELLERAAELSTDTNGARQCIHLDPLADAFMRELKYRLKDWKEDDYRDVREAASRAWENTLRLAAVFHVICSQGGEISLEFAQRAWDIVQWSLTQHRIILTEISQTPTKPQIVQTKLLIKKTKVPRPAQNARELIQCLEHLCRNRGRSWVNKDEVELLANLAPKQVPAAWKWLTVEGIVEFSGNGGRTLVYKLWPSNSGAL